MKIDILSELVLQDEIAVQAHINNISFPKGIEELEYYIYDHGCYNVEDVLQYRAEEEFSWTVPRCSKIGDIVLFFHAKTAIQWIRKLETATTLISDTDTNHNKKILFAWLKKARELYKDYGGKIFAVARVSSTTYYENFNDMPKLHYGGRIFADIDDIVVFENPIDISEFSYFFKISRQSGITMIPYNGFEALKEIILSKNKNLPPYFKKYKIGNLSLSKINCENFLDLTQDYRRRFILEAEFRSYYVDYILKRLFGKEIYRECVCHTQNPKVRYYVDNVFFTNDKILMLEVKLNINNEKNIVRQLEQYTNSYIIDISKDYKTSDYERNYMYVIDTMSIYKYDALTKSIKSLVDLDDIRTLEDVDNLKAILI